ncbi:MAG: ATP-grasp domain-containing protein [Rhodocyclaceae bacterium]|nr:ATP-grasp domain-containing protein [Rhodocyclaceae bacterium]
MQHMLIVATSGRALAQCAARSGFSSVVLDCFGDTDTRKVAASANVISDTSGIGIDGDRLLEAAEVLSPPHETDALVYGAGFESDPELLERFSRRYPLRGNSPDVVRSVKDPISLTRLLDLAGLPHPETRLDPPEEDDCWLIKRIGGAGGQHVRACANSSFEPGRDYFQRRVRGAVCSALFLVDRQGARIIGFSEALPTGDGVGAPFAYSGSVSHAIVPQRIYDELAFKLDVLARLAGLVGLNGIDFVIDGGTYSILEINPRPTATLELYDPDVMNGLLAAHVAACSGESVTIEQSWGPVRAHAIVFARNQLKLPRSWRPARWCSDIPTSEAVVDRGMPICSVRAEGRTHAEVIGQIQRYRAAVLESLEEVAA